MAQDARTTTADGGETIVVLTLRFKPGTVDKVLDGIRPAMAPTRAEPGNTQFDVFRAKEDADVLVIFERWKSRQALEAHWKLPYTKAVTDLFDAYALEPLVPGKNVLYLEDQDRSDGRPS